MATGVGPPSVEVVALTASAGGLDALSRVLGDLPSDFPASVVVQLHLGGDRGVLPAILAMRTRQRVGWAVHGQLLTPGQVVVCPPGVDMELLPGGSCRLSRLDGIGVRRFDVLLASMARSYGARSVAVVLSGTGQDGAQGTDAMRRCGALVIAQSPETAAYPAMPIAAAKAGAALVLPIGEIGRALIDIVGSASVSRWRDDLDSAQLVFRGPGEIRALLRETNWGATPLGFLDRWPVELRMMMRASLDSGQPMAVWWGSDDLHMIEEMSDGAGGAVHVLARPLGPASTTVGVLFFRIHGAIVAVNDAFVRRSGYQHDEPTGSLPSVNLAGAEFRSATSNLLRRSVEQAGQHGGETIRGGGHGAWALYSPILVADALVATGDTGEDEASSHRFNSRLEEQFRGLMRASGREGRPGGSSWRKFNGQSVDEWIGWGLVNVEGGALPHVPVRAVRAGNRSVTRAKAIPLRPGGPQRVPNELSRSKPSDAARRARSRADAAGVRAVELRSRRRDLAAGSGATEQTAAIARLRAAESRRRARLARQSAGAAARRRTVDSG